MELIELWDADEAGAYDLFSSFPEYENGFENIAYGLGREEFGRLVERKERNSRGEELPSGFVPDTVYLLADDGGEYVGIFNFRHYLTPFLEEGPGHIGYAVRRDMRGRGYALAGLRLLLREASPQLSDDEFYLSCSRQNEASLTVMLRAGGYIHHTDDTQYYVRIGRL